MSYTYQGLVGTTDIDGYPVASGTGRGLLGFASRSMTGGNGIRTDITYSQANQTGQRRINFPA